ncbi:MAG: DedA family protein [Alphaproteobacteria bacterium]|nr:MAG: DedA family protein [Alphaproteobacteria bacterium]
MLHAARGPHAEKALAIVSFIESSIFPIPPDVMLIPMCLANRDRAFRFALVCTLASVLGGMLGYAIGFFAFETVGKWILDLYNAQGLFHDFQEKFNAWGFGWVLMAGFTPFPFKVITIVSGVTQLNLFLFVLAAIVSRAGRFFLVAALLWRFGEPMHRMIEKHFALLSWLFFALLVGGFFAIKWIAG